MVETSASRESLLNVGSDVLLLIVHPEKISSTEQAVDEMLGGMIARRRGAERLRTGRGEVTSFYSSRESGPDRVTLVGIGENEMDALQLRRTIATVVRSLIEEKVTEIAAALEVPGFTEDSLPAIVEGCLLGGYTFEGYKKPDENGVPTGLRRLTVGHCGADGDMPVDDVLLHQSTVLALATCAARDLGNEPANVLTPRVFAERAVEMSGAHGLEHRVYDEHALEDAGLGLLLGVARGSEEPARVIEMVYANGDGEVPTLVLIGKGLTFDSGGISIKGAEGMHEMKHDMGGAAAVYGAMMAIAQLQPTGIRVVGLIGAVENMPDGRALKPGDVLTACDGTSVEVINTDAEGRLVLGDLVAHAVAHHDPDWIVDAATLTGAVMVALGDQAAGVVSSDDALYRAIERAGRRAGERFWQLPAYEDYREQLKSKIADLKNSGSRHAGAITGGLFIGAFRGERPWAHLDIAGVAWTDKAKALAPVGATGFAVRSLALLPGVLNEDEH